MSELKNALAIFPAAMLGGYVRYAISSFLPRGRFFPLATLLVNYLGIFLLLYLVKGYWQAKKAPERLLLGLSVGFCGGLTTFSGFLLGSLKLVEQGRYIELGLYLLLTIAGGFLLAKWAGKRGKA